MYLISACYYKINQIIKESNEVTGNCLAPHGNLLSHFRHEIHSPSTTQLFLLLLKTRSKYTQFPNYNTYIKRRNQHNWYILDFSLNQNSTQICTKKHSCKIPCNRNNLFIL